jgi:hypothetical protein
LDLTTLKWEAKHTDKTVHSPDYVDIRRETLQSITLYKKTLVGRDEIVKITRPETVQDGDKWLISFRMRSQLVNGELARRFWIINDRTRGKVTRVRESGEIEEGTWESFAIKPANITGIDET